MAENSRDQALFVRMIDASGLDRVRWQSHWPGEVQWEGKSWAHQRLRWDAITAGAISGDQASISFPDLPSTAPLYQQALDGRWLVELRLYQWRKSLALTGPTNEVVLVASALGEVASGSRVALAEFTLKLGSGVARVGSYFPPGVADTAAIGTPCLL